MLELFQSGGPVMYPLLLCSILSLTIIIERALFWARSDLHANRDIISQILDQCAEQNWKAIQKIAVHSDSFVSRILISGILHRHYSMTKAMESAAADEIDHMRRFMGVLDTIITIAPLLGILGTVTGIISSFDMLGAGIEHPETVTRGIAQALITTASGLGIAILTVFAYNYFNGRIERAVRTIEKYATSLELCYERNGDEGGPIHEN